MINAKVCFLNITEFLMTWDMFFGFKSVGKKIIEELWRVFESTNYKLLQTGCKESYLKVYIKQNILISVYKSLQLCFWYYGTFLPCFFLCFDWYKIAEIHMQFTRFNNLNENVLWKLKSTSNYICMCSVLCFYC